MPRNRLRADSATTGPVAAEQLGELAVEVDELASHGLTFLRVGTQKLRPGRAAEDRTQLPAEVPGVGHGHVHALPGLGGVGVAGVAGDEDPRGAGGHVGIVDVVELVGDPVTDPVHREPHGLLDVQGVGREHAPRLGQHLLGLEPGVVAVAAVKSTNVVVEIPETR